MTRTIVLIDGEHHPPVIRAALDDVGSRGMQVVAAVFLGGREKLSGELDLGGVPVEGIEGDATWHAQRDALERAIGGFDPELVLDLSDAPVVDEERRLRLAAVALARGVAYRGADFRVDVPRRPRLCERPSVAVIAAAKRAGKTAVAGHLARLLAARGRSPVVVAMGRGGPPDPVIVRGDLARPSLQTLLKVVREGGHAASDFYEDAVLAGVATVGARRAGAGLAGAPFYDNVAEAVAAANGIPGDVLVLEGSGSAIPPVAADATVLVLRAVDRPDLGFGIYRLLLADLVVVTMAEEPAASTQALSDLSSSLNDLAGCAVVRTVFRPIPVTPVRGRTIFYATTAPETMSEKLVAYLESIHGARVAGVSHNLGDRDALERDLSTAEGTYEVLLTELKAAAIEVAAARALATGASVVFADNMPVALDGEPGLDEALLAVVDAAADRFGGRPAAAR
jgi:cyclic 2,3-diphosphoglycerate synthase